MNAYDVTADSWGGRTMTRLSAVLFGILGAVVCVGVGTRLLHSSPEVPSIRVLSRLNGPVYVIAVEPVSADSLRAFTDAISHALPLEVRLTDKWVIDERQWLSWEGDIYDADELIDVMRQAV